MKNKLTSIRDNTLNLLRNRPITLTFNKISDDTGISVSWLKAFSTGQTDNPGVNTVETLQAYLMANINR